MRETKIKRKTGFSPTQALRKKQMRAMISYRKVYKRVQECKAAAISFDIKIAAYPFDMKDGWIA